MKRNATFDSTRTYRYRLERRWDTRRRAVGFVMLNPSAADATKDDPTIRRCVRFAQSWGYGSLIVVNLFAFCASDPRVLSRVPDPVGPDNDDYILAVRDEVEALVLAWGVRGSLAGRDRAVLVLLGEDAPLYCLGTTRTGAPRHPLFLPRATTPVPFPTH